VEILFGHMDLWLILPEIILLNTILLLFIYNFFAAKYFISIYNLVIFINIILINFFFLYIYYYKLGISKLLIFQDDIIFDDITILSKCFIIGCFILVFYLLIVYFIHYRIFLTEYISLVLFLLFATLCVLSAYDFLYLYITVELQALCSYVLAASKINSKLSVEAGLKYFIVGAFASALFLFGIATLYNITGLTNFYKLKLYFVMNNIITDNTFHFTIFFAIIFIFCGLFFKLGLAPFHFWLPDVYQGSPLPIIAFFSILPKLSIVIILIRLHYTIFNSVIIPFIELNNKFLNFIIFENILVDRNLFLTFFLTIGLLSLFIGAINALGQFNIKRFFAYSSINNLGFFLISYSLGLVTGVEAAIIYFFVYLFLSMNFFILVVLTRFFVNNLVIKLIDLSVIDIFLLQISFSLLFFSMAGVPPLLGFFSKFYVYLNLFLTKNYFIVIVVGLLMLLSTFYYIRITVFLFFLQGLKKYTLQKKNNYLLPFFSGIFFFLNIFLFTQFDILVFLVKQLVLNLF
jgi:NADH-quinone oxidoreductase subunit N